MLRALNVSTRHVRVAYALGKPALYSSTPANLSKLVNVLRTPEAFQLEDGAKPPLKPKGMKYMKRTVSTLDVSKLQSLDHIVLASYSQPYFTFSDQRSSGRIEFYKTNAPNSRRTIHWPFPPDTSGFLYYHPGHHSSGIEGQVRFRITSRNDPESFKLGRDLQTPDGSPWSIPLLRIASRSAYTGIRQSLIVSSLVTHELMTKCATIVKNSPGFHPSKSTMLPSVDTPFQLSLEVHDALFWVPDYDSVLAHPFRIRYAWEDRRNDALISPYQGSLLLRLERSMLPQHAQTRTVVLRLLKVLEPIKCVIPGYDGYVPIPREGELISKATRIWSRDVDNCTKESAFRLLYKS